MKGGGPFCAGLAKINVKIVEHALRGLCSCSDSSNSSKWVYAVFWRILPRNYPPPKWDYGGGALDRCKGNKRNWILVWEDGFCDFYECERAGGEYMKGRFGADVFFKMSHEVYNYGEGLVGKVAADNSHKWVFRESPNENDPGFISSWNVSIDPQPRAWEFQFNSGIQTIAIISVREGIIQLGSFDKMVEDLNLVISIQRKFSYLQSIPGIFSIQRPYLPIQQPNATETSFSPEEKCQLAGAKRLYSDRPGEPPIKSINLGWNSPQNGVAGPAIWSIPPLLPTMSCSLGALLSKLPSVLPSYNHIEAHDTTLLSNNSNSNINSTSQRLKVNGVGGLNEIQIAGIKLESSCLMDTNQEEKPSPLDPCLGLRDELGFGRAREGGRALNLN
uniref:Transcription factor MYC/MYB N-terminal domain-containing protein n=1 Tax=Vitis vinifera TaxID=29760 RepID=A5B6Y3_VITVI|nr:hypothetical protein VITISV_001147 [Vitis vinifera]